MTTVDIDIALTLLIVAFLSYALADLIPRVDAMDRSYRKFLALTSLGIGYLVVVALLLTVISESTDGSAVAIVLGLAVAAFVLYSLTLLGDVFDDWLRLFADPEFNTLVELSMVLAVVILLFILFLIGP